MKLKCTGRIVLHRPMANGATEAYFADGSAMTSEEWGEYADRVRDKSLAEAWLTDRWKSNRALFPMGPTLAEYVGANLPDVLDNETRMGKLRSTPRKYWDLGRS